VLADDDAVTLRPVLWNVVRDAKGDEAALRKLLTPANQEQLIHLHRKLDEAAAVLYLDERFIAHAKRGAAPRLAVWVVSQGRKAWHDAQRDPTAVPREAPVAPNFPAVFASLYRERFANEIPDHEPDPVDDTSLAYDPAWEEMVWDLADLVSEGIPITEATTGYTRSDLVRLDLALQEVVERLRLRANETLGKDGSGMGWREWAEWVVGHGTTSVDGYFANPAKAPRHVPDDAETTMLTAQLDAEYLSRFGEHMPAIARA
jgi:hypothetical protein